MKIKKRTVKPVSQNHLSQQPWWKGSIIYQIYPRSFMDSNKDGVGDLSGIIKKLDYVAKLNVDGVWLSPFFKSPMKDFGYDVSDYNDVDPLFGNLLDFKKLVTKAKSLGLKVIIDQVLNHTSNQHPWFKESRSGRKNPKADWYVWANPRPDGTPPNNWLSIFGGSAWQWDTYRKQYYLHIFLKEQPDLNFHNPQVRKALLKSMEFWLKLGVDGFRLDTVNFYFHSPTLRNNPPLKPKNNSGVKDTNPYAYQKHLYDKTQSENIDFLKDMRKLLDGYSRFGDETMTIGEVGDDNDLQVIAEYTQNNDRLHTCYSFLWLGDNFSANYIKSSIENFNKVIKDGWACWPFSNHDVERVATRWGRHFPKISFSNRQDMVKLLLALQVSLKGSVCLYQGDELGFTEAEVPFEFFQDPYGIEMYPKFKGRDGCRTPMIWNSKSLHGGFSAAKKTWLPIALEHSKMAVDIQEAHKNSVLMFTRKILKFRKEYPELLWGDIKVLSGPKFLAEEILVLERVYQGRSLKGFFSLNNSKKKITLSSPSLRILGSSFFDENLVLSKGMRIVKNDLVLDPFAFGFYK